MTLHAACDQRYAITATTDVEPPRGSSRQEDSRSADKLEVVSTRPDIRSGAPAGVLVIAADPQPAPVTASATALAAALAVVLLAVLFLAVCTAGPAAAAPGAFTVERIDKPLTIRDLQRQARRARADMGRLRARLEDISARYDEARARLDAVNRDLTRARLDLERAEAQLEAQRTLVSLRLAAMYKTGHTTLLDVLAGVSDFSELDSALTLLRRMAESDQAEQERLERLAEQTADLAAALDIRRDEALAIEEEIEGQRAELALALEERRAVLEDLTGRLERALAAGLPPELMKAPPGGHTPVTWAKALLLALRMPTTTQNMAAIIAWEMAEGGHWYNSAHYNPLNTTWRMPGATSMNSVGVKAYVSWAQGLAATLNTLHNGLYERILAALRAGNDAQAVADAVAASPWGTGSFAVRL